MDELEALKKKRLEELQNQAAQNQVGEQAQLQQQENEKFRLATEAQQEPLKRLGYFSDIMQGLPAYQATAQYKTPPYTNPLLGAIGAGLGTYGILQGNNPSGAFGLGTI